MGKVSQWLRKLPRVYRHPKFAEVSRDCLVFSLGVFVIVFIVVFLYVTDFSSVSFVKNSERPVTYEAVLDEESNLSELQHMQDNLTLYIAGHYKNADKSLTRQIVLQAFLTGQKADIDPLLILAVIATESSFNPFAQSSVGAQGLMQVHTKVHVEKFQRFGGLNAVFDPVANIEVGTQILKGYLVRGGSVGRALHLYVGAGNRESDDGYGDKVLVNRALLVQAAMGDVEEAKRNARKRRHGKLGENARSMLAPFTTNIKLENMVDWMQTYEQVVE